MKIVKYKIQAEEKDESKLGSLIPTGDDDKNEDKPQLVEMSTGGNDKPSEESLMMKMLKAIKDLLMPKEDDKDKAPDPGEKLSQLLTKDPKKSIAKHFGINEKDETSMQAKLQELDELTGSKDHAAEYGGDGKSTDADKKAKFEQDKKLQQEKTQKEEQERQEKQQREKEEEDSKKQEEDKKKLEEEQNKTQEQDQSLNSISDRMDALTEENKKDKSQQEELSMDNDKKADRSRNFSPSGPGGQ